MKYPTESAKFLTNEGICPKKTNEYGNKFRFRAKVWDANKAKVGRWAWDVFLISKQ
jgi:hypothetical protein